MNNMIPTAQILLIILYLLICLLIGFLSFRRKSEDSFLIANRKVKIIPLVSTLCAGFVGGGVLVTFTALAFEYGISSIWMFVGASLGLFVFPTLIGKKLKPLADEKEFHTLSDYFYHKFGKRSGLLSGIIVFIMFLALLLVQFIAGGKLLSAISGWPYVSSVLIMGTIIFLYLMLGGFSSVVKTDLFQFFVMLTLIFVLIFSFNKTISISPAQYNLFSVGIGQIVGFSLIGLFVLLISADVWQRAYASASKKTLKKGFYLAGLVLLLFGLAISIVGIVAKNNFPTIDSQEALYYGFSHLLPSGLVGIALIFIFASIMSSADTFAFVASMNISKDFIGGFKRISKQKLVKITRISIFILILLSILTAIFIQNIVNVVFAVVSIGLALAPAMVGSFIWKLKEKAVFYSILLGLLSAIILIAVGFITPETSIVTLPVSLIVLIFGQIFLKKSAPLKELIL
ncbi:MAG TPA: sodium:solute symporter family protein [Saprospiraceae bacterium]|nr:sodium:solute symporter family protein [Saprospiraceae bacterium]